MFGFNRNIMRGIPEKKFLGAGETYVKELNKQGYVLNFDFTEMLFLVKDKSTGVEYFLEPFGGYSLAHPNGYETFDYDYSKCAYRVWEHICDSPEFPTFVMNYIIVNYPTSAIAGVLPNSPQWQSLMARIAKQFLVPSCYNYDEYTFTDLIMNNFDGRHNLETEYFADAVESFLYVVEDCGNSLWFKDFFFSHLTRFGMAVSDMIKNGHTFKEFYDNEIGELLRTKDNREPIFWAMFKDNYTMLKVQAESYKLDVPTYYDTEDDSSTSALEQLGSYNTEE